MTREEVLKAQRLSEMARAERWRLVAIALALCCVGIGLAGLLFAAWAYEMGLNQ